MLGSGLVRMQGAVKKIVCKSVLSVKSHPQIDTNQNKQALTLKELTYMYRGKATATLRLRYAAGCSRAKKKHVQCTPKAKPAYSKCWRAFAVIREG